MTNFNGVWFFDDPLRIPFHLFIDAYKKGIKGFYYKRGSSEWGSNINKIAITSLFLVPIIDIIEEASFNINVYKVRAVRLALE
jgi:hypothetical protein